MLKRIKLHKLDERCKAYMNAAIFCYLKHGEMLRTLEFLTEEGEERWQGYAKRFNILMDAYERLTKEYDELTHRN